MNKFLAKAILLSLLFTFSYGVSIAQTSVEKLKIERLTLIKGGKSTREVDKQLMEMGTRMPARVKQSKEGDVLNIEFAFLFGNTPKEVEKYQTKFSRSGLPGFLSLKINPTTYLCTAQFKAETSNEDLRRFFLAQGYEGFEVVSENK